MTAFTAYLKTKLVLKTRSPITTFFELVSPALFVGILVLGYFLSDVDTIEAGLTSSKNVVIGDRVFSRCLVLRYTVNADI